MHIEFYYFSFSQLYTKTQFFLQNLFNCPFTRRTSAHPVLQYSVNKALTNHRFLGHITHRYQSCSDGTKSENPKQLITVFECQYF